MRQRLSEHVAVRASTLLLTCSLLTLGCGEAAKSHEASGRAANDELVAAKVEPAPAPEPVAIAEVQPAAPEAVIESPEQELPPTDAEAEVEPEGQHEPAPEPEAKQAPSDSLAPILPDAPEPGSPEADAELAELLEESTLTQEEFDAAFRNSKPKVAGDQFVFGPGDRTRKRPVISFGTPKIENSKLAASEISALAKAHVRGFEGCLAVALTDNPSTKGSVTLRLRFDAKGKAESATIEGGAALPEPLRECLAAVADSWTLADAAGATVGLSLTLASE